MDEMNDELRKMIDQDNSVMNMTRTITKMYEGFVDAGLSNELAIELVKHYITKVIEMTTIHREVNNE